MPINNATIADAKWGHCQHRQLLQLNFVTNIVAMVIDNGQMPVICIIAFDINTLTF